MVFVPEKGGILKKPGVPYGPIDPGSSLDREKWLEENADRLSRLDRLSASSQNQLPSAGTAGQHGKLSIYLPNFVILLWILYIYGYSIQ